MSYSDNDLFVRFGAQTGDLKAGTAAAAAAVDDAVRKISGDLSTLNKTASGATSGVNAAFGGLATGVKQQLASISGSVAGIQGIFAAFQSMFVAGAIGAGIAKVVQITDKYAGLQGRLSLVTNSTEELTTAQNELYDIAQRSRVGYDTTIDLYTRLARSTKDSLAPSQKDLLTVTEAINKALIVSGSAGESANAALIQLGQGMGSGTLRGEELNSVLEQTPRLAQMIADGMGITVGQLRSLGQEGKLTSRAVFEALLSQAETIDKEFSRMPITVEQSMTLMRNAFDRVVVEANQASEATTTLSGTFSDFATWVDTNRETIVKSIALIMQAFSEMAGVVTATIGEAMGLVGDLADQIAQAFGEEVPGDLDTMGSSWQMTAGIIAGAALTIKQAVAAVIASVKVLGNALVTLNDIATKTVFFGTQGNPLDAFSSGVDRQRAIFDEYQGKLTALQTEYEQQLGRQGASPKAGGSAGTGGAVGGVPKGGSAGKGKKSDPSRMAEYEEGLNAKRMLAIQREQHELGLAEELAYWQSILATQRVSAKDRQRIESTVSSLKLQIMRQELQQQNALSAEEISEKERAALDQIAIEEERSKTDLALGKITKAQALRQDRQFEDQKYEIERAAQQRRIEMAKKDPNNPIQQQKEYDKLLQIIRKHNLKVSQITGQQMTESQREWKGLFDSIGQGMGNALGGFIAGTQSFYQMLSGLFTSIQNAFAQMIAQMIANWITGHLTMLAQKMGILSTEEAAEATASATRIGLKKAEAAAVIPAEAGIAAGGAASAVAAIPVVGPGLAAAAYSSTMAMVMSGLAVASAAGGFDVPAGVNPMTQLHEKEMVLPAKYADVIRSMSEGNGGGKRSGGDTHIHISAVDAKSVEKLFRREGGSIVKSLNNQSRNFRRS